MANLIYVTGDATKLHAQPGVQNKILAHIVNDRGGWGRGFVVAISQMWETPEAAYRFWYKGRHWNNFGLGEIQTIQVDPFKPLAGYNYDRACTSPDGCVFVTNMVAQHGYHTVHHEPPIRYDAVTACLQKLAVLATDLRASVHMPRIGCGLAGGNWELIVPIITDNLIASNIDVIVYDLT